MQWRQLAKMNKVDLCAVWDIQLCRVSAQENLCKGSTWYLHNFLLYLVARGDMYWLSVL